jgi:hypothetical protein
MRYARLLPAFAFTVCAGALVDCSSHAPLIPSSSDMPSTLGPSAPRLQSVLVATLKAVTVQWRKLSHTRYRFRVQGSVSIMGRPSGVFSAVGFYHVRYGYDDLFTVKEHLRLKMPHDTLIGSASAFAEDGAALAGSYSLQDRQRHESSGKITMHVQPYGTFYQLLQ